MSLRWRVVLIVMLMNCAAVGLGLALGVGKARAAVRAEMTAALDAAELVLRSGGARPDLVTLDLRHVRAPGEASQRKRAPHWFEALVGIDEVVRDVAVGERRVAVVASPRDEVAEAWGELLGWFTVAAATLTLTALATWWAVTRALAPLHGFGRALEAMAHERPGGALAAAGTPELEAVSKRIAALDAGLLAERGRNAELSRALIELQDAERADIAREVHDELGPLLFAIGVDAHALTRADDGGGIDRAAVRERARSIGGLVGDVRAVSRRILGRLRPMALDHLPLSAVLADLFADARARHPDVALETELMGDLDDLGEAQTLALYRVVQEAVLNALRHAQPACVTVHVAASEEEVRVEITDDGRGIGAPAGHGVLGMRERVAALGGGVRIGTSDTGGAKVEVQLPRLSMAEAA